MKSLRLLIYALLLGLAGGGCETTYEVPGQLKRRFGTDWQKYINPRNQVAIGFFGQSNAQGIGDSSLSPHLPDSTAYEWLFQQNGPSGSGWLQPLHDPMSSNRPASLRTNTGSMVPACVLRYKELTGLTPVVSHCAGTGTWVLYVPGLGNGGWEPGGYLRTLFFIQMRKMLEATGIERMAWVTMTLGETDGLHSSRYDNLIGLFPDGMIVPGAYDASTGFPNGYSNPTHKPDLYTAYKELFADLRTNFPGVRININQSGTWLGMSSDHREGVINMWAVQEHLARTIPEVYCEMKDAKFFEQFGYMRDDHVHYNQMGLNYMGKVDAEIMAAH